MKAKTIVLIALLVVGLTHSVFARNSGASEAKTDDTDLLDLFDDDLSAFSVMKLEGGLFKVEDFDGNNVTADVKALKTPNKMDLLFYEQKSGSTSICYDFYNTETKNEEWLECDIISTSPTGLHWILSNNFKSFYIIQNGLYLDMEKFKLKASPSNPNEYIVQENGVDKYIMKDLKGKSLDQFYPLELLNQ